MEFENKSGIVPVEFKVLIQPDSMEKKTEGGIIRPDILQDREGWAQVKGTLVARGSRAFEDFGRGENKALVPGVRVYFRKYEGILMEGADGSEYRLCNDKDIGAIVTDEAALPSVAGRNRAGLDAA